MTNINRTRNLRTSAINSSKKIFISKYLRISTVESLKNHQLNISGLTTSHKSKEFELNHENKIRF